jgi:hypothetical protein
VDDHVSAHLGRHKCQTPLGPVLPVVIVVSEISGSGGDSGDQLITEGEKELCSGAKVERRLKHQLTREAII